MVIVAMTTCASADNKRMIEQSGEELLKLNEQAVRQVPNLPSEGKVQLKAKVYPQADDTYRIEILESKVTEKPKDVTPGILDSSLLMMQQ